MDQSHRKRSGSHYTPNDLIELLLKHTIDPALDERVNGNPREEAVKAILSMAVVDPTCGSGHFLVAAGRRIGRRLAEVRFGPDPTNEQIRDAIRDVVGHCLYGVDLNEMATEIAKVALWLEAMEPGKPLTFLEHHIKCGNALLGCFESELKAGIPDEAYKLRPENKKTGFSGDDPEACKVLKKRNEQTRKNQQLTSFDDDFKDIQEVLRNVTHDVDALDSDTVVGIRAKENLYDTGFRGTDEYVRMRRAMDAWCAAFTYRKWRPEHPANILTSHANDVLRPSDPGEEHLHPESLELIETERNSLDNAFFHWEIEFPEVLERGGFDVVIGNPPYKGGSKISGELGHHYNHLFAARWSEYQTRADLACAMLLQFWNLRHASGRVGVIVTNTIGKGETREMGLARLLGGPSPARIVAAYPDITWPGEAAVVVAVVALSSNPKDSTTLNGLQVPFVSSRLDALPEADIRPIPNRQRTTFEGDKPAGKGFLVPPPQAWDWIRSDPRNEAVLFPYLTADDILQNPGMEPSRWAICFHDWGQEKARSFSLPYAALEETVRGVREGKAGYGDWWKFGRYRAELRRAMKGLSSVIVRPIHTETPLFVRMPTTYVFSNATAVIASGDPALLALLNSGIHEVWYRRQGGGMKHDLRYSPSQCFDTFPLPLTEHGLPAAGEDFYQALMRTAGQRKEGLTSVWNDVNDPACNVAGIAEIRHKRDVLTHVAGKCFGLPPSMDFAFGFYSDPAGRSRYTMSPAAADQVYLRLVAINQSQASGEAAMKPLEKGQSTLVEARP